jgi:hypothetical protein
MSKPLKDPDDAFMRKIHWPEEDRRHYTRLPYTGGYRWFRSENVIPIERARAPSKPPSSKPDEAA